MEDLRRWRQEGRLNGTEWVWRDGMTNWEPLDSILGPVAPPPLPASVAKAKRTSPLVWVAVGGIVLLVLGAIIAGVRLVGTRPEPEDLLEEAGPKQSVTLASKPVAWGTNTMTEADVRKRAKAFRVRQWLDGYRERGQRDQPCDADAVQFLETWIAQNYDGVAHTNGPSVQELGRRLADAPACADPLVLTVAGINSLELHESIRRLERALNSFDQSKHRAYPKFYATVSLARGLAGNSARVSALDAAAVTLLKEAFADGSFLPDDQADIGELLLNGACDEFFKRNGASVSRVPRAAGKSFEWLALVLEGEHRVNEAWKARGGGYANTVSEKGWEGFSSHLAAARQSFAAAWELRPEWPLAASRMVTVAMGDSGAAEMWLWFDRAVAAQLDYPGAWLSMRWGLRPRWHGTPDALLAFGVSAMETRRFDTDVPRKFFDVVGDLESELELPRGQHIYGREDIWPHLQRMYEGYIAEPAQAAARDGWRSSYAVVAYWAEKYDVARTQLEAVNWAPRPGNLAGWGADLSLMPLEVAARTSAVGAKITAAESSRKHRKAAQTLPLYAELASLPEADDRTRTFVRHRLAALELERRLQEGGWVDFLPTEQEDPNWARLRGHDTRLPDGALEVQSGPDGHFLFSRVRVGAELEVKGEFDVVRSSNRSFQAGLVLGLPDLTTYNWYSFRVKRNDVEGDVASFARAWTKQQIYQPVQLNDGRNSFYLRLQPGKISASMNGKDVFREAKPPQSIAASRSEFFLGLGAFNDMNETVIRYRNLQVRALTHGQRAGNN